MTRKKDNEVTEAEIENIIKLLRGNIFLGKTRLFTILPIILEPYIHIELTNVIKESFTMKATRMHMSQYSGMLFLTEKISYFLLIAVEEILFSLLRQTSSYF
jgi:hypothetical protein